MAERQGKQPTGEGFEVTHTQPSLPDALTVSRDPFHTLSRVLPGYAYLATAHFPSCPPTVARRASARQSLPVAGRRTNRRSPAGRVQARFELPLDRIAQRPGQANKHQPTDDALAVCA